MYICLSVYFSWLGNSLSLFSLVYFLLQLSINGDKEFLDYMPKVNPYHLTSVIAVAVGHQDEGKEAGPLPVKVDLTKTSL